MAGVAWGNAVDGIRFGIRPPPAEVEAGSTVTVEVLCENRGARPVRVFGFAPRYPRALRLSPPKTHRPHLRVSFADLNVLHPPDAFVRLLPGAVVSAGLDLSFAFDRRGAGLWPIAFGYDPVRSTGMTDLFVPPPGGMESGVAELTVTSARSLREAGIDEQTEIELDEALLSGEGTAIARIRELGPGGTAFLTRRIARILSTGGEAIVGWRALELLSLLGHTGELAARTAADELPHAEAALLYAADWAAHRAKKPPAAEHMPFVTELERLLDDVASRGNLVISWTAFESDVHGQRRLELFGDGTLILTARLPGGGAVPSTRRSRLDADRVRSVLEAIRLSAAWLLRPLRERGMPDEPRPALEIQLALGEPYGRRVAMWNGEWREGPARPIADLLDRLAAAGGSSFPSR